MLPMARNLIYFPLMFLIFCQLEATEIPANRCESTDVPFLNLLQNVSDTDATWSEMAQTFALMRNELAAFKPKPNQISLLPPVTGKFLCECFARCCALLNCEIPNWFIIWGGGIISPYASFEFSSQQKAINISNEYLNYIISAIKPPEVRVHYYELMLVLMHELGHLNDQNFLGLSRFDVFIESHATTLAWITSLFGLSFTIEGVKEKDKQNGLLYTGLFIEAIALTLLIAYAKKIYNRRTMELTADQTILKGTNNHPDTPEMFGEALNQIHNLATKNADFLTKTMYEASANGWLNFLNDHPTDASRVEKLHDIIKKIQAQQSKVTV